MIGANPKPDIRGERGAALITAAVTLLLISVLAVTFMVTVRGERAMSSNVHVAKGSLYAADAGIRSTQQVLADTAGVRLARYAATWPGTGPVIPSPAAFFTGGPVSLTSTSPNFAATATIAFADSDLLPQSQTYNYRYTITSTGRQGQLGLRTVQSQGILRVSASRGTFADFLIFTDQHLMPDGSNIWFTSSGYFDGRVHTNGKFRFAYQPTFEDQITSVNTQAAFYNGGSPIDLASDHNGTIDVPRLGPDGFQRGAPSVALPPNSYNQQNAALGPPLSPTSSSAPSTTDIRTALGITSGSGVPNGIYLPNDGSGNLRGGIYIQGDLTSCVCGVDSSGRQTYRMTQGSTTKIITVDPSAGRTYVKVGSTTTTYNGVPRGVMYTNGSMQSLGGPARAGDVVPPGIADGTNLLIAAKGDVVLQSDLTYNDYHDGNSVLGIFSDGHSIRVGSSAPDDCYLDAYVMATGATDGAFQVDNYNSGSPRGTFHLRGGMVAEFYGAFYTFRSDGTLRTGFARDFRYDRRGLVPPYYPSTPLMNPNSPLARTVAWKEM